MNIRGKAWCPGCQKQQPASLVGLSIDGDEKKVNGFCSICEHPVERVLALKPTKSVVHSPPKENNCVPLHPRVEKKAPPVIETVEKSPQVEQPSWVTLVGLFSVCLVITYLL